MTTNVETLYKARPKFDYGRVQLTTVQKQELKEAFDLFLSDKRQTVRPVDMLKVYEKLQAEINKSSFHEMLRFMNTEQNNLRGLTFDEFVEQATEFFNELHTAEGVERVFSLFDSKHSGALTATDLQRISNQFDLYLSSEQINLIMQRASVDGQAITLADFEYIMKKEDYK